jgi:hypothetical protein
MATPALVLLLEWCSSHLMFMLESCKHVHQRMAGKINFKIT